MPAVNSWFQLLQSVRTQLGHARRGSRVRRRQQWRRAGYAPLVERLEDRALLSGSAISVAVSANVLENSGTALTYTFSRTGGDTSGAIDVSYSLAGSAIAADYTNSDPTPVTIPDGAVSASFTITPVDDVLVEGDETVVVTITGVTGVGNSIGAPNPATGTIHDNETTTASIAANDATASETLIPGLDNGQFTVTLVAAAAYDVVVNYSVTGTAAPTTDYTALSGSVTILAGNTFATIDVNGIINDALIEGNETVIATLTSTNNASVSVGVPASATVTITDNDLTTVSIAANDATAAESPVNNGQFTVTLAAAAANDVVVNYSVTGTASPTADYTALSGSVTILAGNTFATIDVNGIVNDALIEGNETVIATLTSTNNASVSVGVPASATVTITDNDLTTVSIAANDATASETAVNNGQFTVTLVAAAAYDVVVNYSVTGTASPTTDYTALSGSVTILAGNTFATIDVNGIVNDALIEGNETVIATLTSTNNASVSVGVPASATVTITDNDLTTVSIVANDATASETAVNNGQFTVTLVAAAAYDVVVNYSVTGTAAPTTDYTALSGSVTILAGNTFATVDVNGIVNDALIEGNETVIATLTSTNNASVSVGVPASATVTITDNDSATVSISTGATAVEGGATGAITATLNVTTNGVPGGGATLATAVTATLAGNADYSASTVTFAIGAGNLSTGSGPIVVTATQDTLVEGTETFPLQTLTVTGAATAGGTGQTITITDDDHPSSRFFRIYQQNADFHFYTNSLAEFTAVVAQGNTNEATGKAGFGVVTTQLTGTLPLHRIYVPSTGAHYYTFNDAERDSLVAMGGGGAFISEPDMGFIYTAPVPGTIEVFRLYNLPRGVHLFTDSVFERDEILRQYGPCVTGVNGCLAGNSWRLETSLGFAVPQAAGTFTTGGATQVPARRAAALQAAEHLDNISRNTSSDFNQFGSSLDTASVDSSSTVASLLSGQEPTLATPMTASQPGSLRQEFRLPSLSNSVTGDLTDSDLDNFWGNVGVGDQSDSFWHSLN